MELTLDEALQKGIDAHKSGQLHEADKFYTAILAANPGHPDANHNMGVLAVNIGKLHESIPYFKIAIQANPSVAQYWLSYLNVLMRLGNYSEANVLLEQAKTNVPESEALNVVAQQIESEISESAAKINKVSSSSQVESNILDSLNLDSAIKLARKKSNAGLLEEARKIYTDVLDRFPRNKKAIAGINQIGDDVGSDTSALQDPPEEQLDILVSIYNQGSHRQALDHSNRLLERFPNSVTLHLICGASQSGLNNYDLAIESYRKVIQLKPDQADAYNNMANAQKSKGELDAAIRNYRQAIRIRPEYADAYLNLGDALKDNDQLDSALASYKKALKIRPDYADAYNYIGNTLIEKKQPAAALENYKMAIKCNPSYAEAYNNLGSALFNQGKIEAAIDYYEQALKRKPDYEDCFNNLNYLDIQISDPNKRITHSYLESSVELRANLSRNLKHQINETIASFISGNLIESSIRLQEFRNLIEKSGVTYSSQKDRVFCEAYSDFIASLVKSESPKEKTKIKSIYHLGESHCLSYAHATLLKSGTEYSITPKIVFGVKAYHFSGVEESSFKAITKLHLNTLPAGSIVFVSIGEIDCRFNEGIIPASLKKNRPIKNIIDKTIDEYISWFLKENTFNNHLYYFFNIPAPVFNKFQTLENNAKVANVVFQFNSCLEMKLKSAGVKMIDVYTHTKNETGFSNGIYHCDDSHLDKRIIPLIQDQLTD